MFTLKNRSQMQNAIEAAKRNHPKVKVLSLGTYLVQGSAGNFYTVSLTRDGNHKAIDCGCIAGQYGTPCFHSAAALAVHMGLVRIRRAASQIARLVEGRQAEVSAVLLPRQMKAEKRGAFTV